MNSTSSRPDQGPPTRVPLGDHSTTGGIDLSSLMSGVGFDPDEREPKAVTDDVADLAMGVLLYTPAQAARVLGVRESWLRRRAARRQVPCSFLGKHLRFSRSDLEAIVDGAKVEARPQASRTRASRHRR